MAVAWPERCSHTERVINSTKGNRRPGASQYHLPAILIATAGMGVCLAAMFGFVAMVATNNLPWYPGWTIQDHYLEMGRFYSQGFIIGFFLCFFLVMAAVSVSAWLETRRNSTKGVSRSSAPGVRAA